MNSSFFLDQVRTTGSVRLGWVSQDSRSDLGHYKWYQSRLSIVIGFARLKFRVQKIVGQALLISIELARPSHLPGKDSTLKGQIVLLRPTSDRKMSCTSQVQHEFLQKSEDNGLSQAGLGQRGQSLVLGALRLLCHFWCWKHMNCLIIGGNGGIKSSIFDSSSMCLWHILEISMRESKWKNPHLIIAEEKDCSSQE